MPAFKRFGPGDQVDNVLVLEPRYDLASGNLGWRGSPEGSASLSLYGGARRSPVGTVQSVEYQSIFPGAGSLPRPRRGLPLTASVNFVWMTGETLDVTQRSSTRWGEEHWDTIQRLYNDYSHRDPDFVTGTYDYYCVYLQRDSGNVIVGAGGAGPVISMTSSFAIETWIKPFLTASSVHDFTLAASSRMFAFGITGSSGLLVFSSSVGSFTSSFGPQERRWSHVAVSYDAVAQKGAFFVNLQDAGTFSMAPLTGSNSYSGSLTFGGRWGSGTLKGNVEVTSSKVVGSVNQSFHGFMAETRVWPGTRSQVQLSSSYNVSLTGSSATGTISTLRFVEGPLASLSGPARGSGSVDRADATAGTLYYHWSFDDRIGPGWHPNDNVNFISNKSVVSGTAQAMLVVDIPQAFYGRQIVPGTLVLTDRTYSSGSYGMVRVLNDDGRGNLFISGSVCSSSLAAREDYDGVGWNKVGNVFYGEGLVVIKEPALLDFGSIHDGTTTTSHPNDVLQLSFRGQSRVPVKTLMCRVDRGDVNASSNPTFWVQDADGNRVRRHPSGSLYVTTVGIYNSQRELVGVARLADPVRIRDRDRLNFRLRMDF